MTEFPILPSSPQLVSNCQIRDKHNFPWDKLECGQSFKVPKEYIKAETLRPMCSLKGKQMNKKFKMIVHDDCYEVGRVK